MTITDTDYDGCILDKDYSKIIAEVSVRELYYYAL